MMRGGLAALAVLALALAAVMGLELGARTTDEADMNLAPLSAGPQAASAATAPAAVSHRRDWVHTILARPLFAPNRRPPAGLAAAPAGLPRVAGILVHGDSRSVIFAAAGGGKPQVVAEGAEVAGFRVRSIESGQVTVVGPDGPLVLRPSFDPSPRPAAGAAIPGPAGGVRHPRPARARRPARTQRPVNRGLLLIGVVLLGCEKLEPPVLEALPPLGGGETARAAPRVNGRVGTGDNLPAVQVTTGRGSSIALPQATTPGPGDISFDFVDTDIREVVAQVLGTVLRVNYTIDPAVRGTATLRTTNPIARSQVLPVLNAVLAQNGAAITQSAGLYRVVPAAAAAASPGIAGGADLAGGAVIPLRYASAEDLARVLQPYVGAGGKIIADQGRNALIIGGDTATREALVSLVSAFDINALAGQSYALFPVTSGGAKDFATSLADTFRTGAGGSLAGVVRVVPMERMNSVLIVSSQARYIDEARRVYGLIERQRRQTLRGWNVYYLQNSRSNDIAYVLQQAFTPNRVTAVPTPRTPGRGNQRGGFNQNGSGGGGIGGGIGGGGLGGLGGGSGIGGALGANGAGGLGIGGPPQGGAAGGQPDPSQNPANPLLGGLDPTGGATQGQGQGQDDLNAVRIIPNSQNNALLIYATAQERDTIEAMLRKIDILPLQVRIDATIAEVSLNDSLSYGTQFFFKSGGINGALNFSPPGAVASRLLSNFPGFVLSGPNNGNAALNALQAVTTVKVLSSPQVLVLDNEAARLQVGNLVPFLTTSSQSTISNGSPVINSIDYRETGVIMEVTPRVNSGGLVTLDISQEVSDVDTAATQVSQIQSPTFLERKVSSRVVVQDGQTVGLAGLIRDNSSRGNSGIPWLKDVPLLGFLAGAQNNVRGRTELLVLITPHVVHDQRDARALTEDLRDQLINAASVPGELQRQSPSGSPDPNRRIRRSLRLEN